MTLSIREAVIDDLADIIAIDQAGEHSTFLPSTYVNLIAQGQGGDACILLAEWHRQPVAFSATSWVLDEATLLNIVVKTAYRKRGIGAALIQRTLATLAVQQVQRLLLEVRASNHEARALYGKLGFVEDSLRRNYYPGRGTLGGDDAVLMSRPVE